MEGSTTYYSCECAKDFSHSNISNICADDTCNGDKCNEHGSCAFRRTPEGAEYNCSCMPGFVRESADGPCKKDTSPEMYLLIACALIVLAIIIAFSYVIKRMRSKRSNPPYSTQDTPNSSEHGCGTRDDEVSGLEPPYQPVHSDEKRVLIISTEESEEHKDVVQKFAAFIREHVGVVPILPSQHKMEIQKSDLETWLSSQNQHAFKVVFICSRGTREWWNAAKSGCNSLVGASIFGDPFQKMVTITKKERETIGVKGKFLTAYFEDYATWEDIPEFLNDRPCYNLMHDLGELSFALLNREKDTPTSKRRMPEVDNYDLQPEGKALVQAIKRVASLNRRNFQPPHPPQDMPVTSRQPLELFDPQDPLDSREAVPLDLMEIPGDDPGMESIRGIFSSTVAEVGDKHSAGASDENMDSGFDTLPSPSQNGSASMV
ncbi:interleukin-17 receptor D-like isoform X1 [Diadema antillarum]|uniref:interleukin-17 receptor D-like isoform X1 n=1 Tax=Diadema antillarum TaxID=105358 RepID=UPI003A8902C8